eukprot:TRINITY_DN18805_c0_g1_i1.p2 TRINITY_DN18805_c0_g1~~TRINITY_DN18805_c0_g1_i1.p2  ORF type:complete len:128 (-),score=10.92 TRINITY_DN18805_c0_g1_i1:683-1066(-)
MGIQCGDPIRFYFRKQLSSFRITGRVRSKNRDIDCYSAVLPLLLLVDDPITVPSLGRLNIYKIEGVGWEDAPIYAKCVLLQKEQTPSAEPPLQQSKQTFSLLCTKSASKCISLRSDLSLSYSLEKSS